MPRAASRPPFELHPAKNLLRPPHRLLLRWLHRLNLNHLRRRRLLHHPRLQQRPLEPPQLPHPERRNHSLCRVLVQRVAVDSQINRRLLYVHHFPYRYRRFHRLSHAFSGSLRLLAEPFDFYPVFHRFATLFFHFLHCPPDVIGASVTFHSSYMPSGSLRHLPHSTMERIVALPRYPLAPRGTRCGFH